MLPLGKYEEDRLLNLGENRFIIRPQVGFVHSRGPWSFELTTSVNLFTENDDFFGGNERKQDPLYSLQGHVIHTFSNKWWASASGGYRWGGESRINGQRTDDEQSNGLGAFSLGFPIGETQGLKLVYLRGETQRRGGSDTESLFVSWILRF